MALSQHSNKYFNYIHPLSENRFVRSYTPYVFSLITFIILTLFAIRPTFLTISNLQKNVAESRSTLSALEDKIAKIEQGKSNIDSLNEETKSKIQAAIPSNPQIPSLISNLQTSAAADSSPSAMQIQPVNIIDLTSSPSGSLTLEKVEFSYNIQGSYDQVTATINNLINSPRLIEVQNLIVSRRPEDPITLTVSGTALFLK